jgi:hypothetical protein
VYGIASLLVMAGLFLTWRFLIASLWSGQSGSRTLFFGSAATVALTVIVVPIGLWLGHNGVERALLVAPMCIFLIPDQFYLVALPLCAFMVILMRSFPREPVVNSARAQ